ncbi:VOC family protein [Nocardiopsis halophila]|uniref:glyoxalase/bleomycin resistance/dioxygenase family protein n=1 Tax=Nocardiopsis halophila TaxID=141692 RepID=UPI00034DABB5|nr:glyoxalase/bleomycin resistance/dioxygenase family protein [Nocardiopsis halophila]
MPENSVTENSVPAPSPAPGVRMPLLVLYTERLEECRDFYGALGLAFEREKHGDGPEHYAAVLADGTVFELYPAGARPTGRLRLGLDIDGGRARPPLAPGRHVLTDPDGRKVDVAAARPGTAPPPGRE